MAKVFLSHSSKQKEFIEIIAKKLGKSNIVYDAWTFENGNSTLDEIYSGIDNSGIFVFFISNEALNSDWVNKEINLAEEYLKNGKLKRFLPFLIDQSVDHSDIRIPQWIKEEYNIRYISKPTKCYDLIRQALRLVSWDLHPKKKELEQLFIGRTAQIKQFEERIYDIDKPTPIAIIVSGLISIGRRKFIKHVLVNSNKIKMYYSPPTITLDSRNSIEDLIIKLYGLGYTQKSNDSILNLTLKTQNEKIIIVSELLTELSENNDLLIIIDDSCIVNKEGIIVDWFVPIIDMLKDLNTIVLCVISNGRPWYKELIHNQSIFSIVLPELEQYERKALFQSLLNIEQIQINNEHFKIITDQFSGYPEQVFYTMALIINEGINYVVENPYEIIHYNTEKVAKLVKNFESNQLALQVLKILSETEFLSFNILEDILQDDFELAKKILTQFSNIFVIEYIGSAKEFLRLNDAVKDYIQRLGYKLDDKYSKNIQNHVKKAFENYDFVDRDISDYVISFKEALKQGYEVPKEFLIPSHYVNAMRELYNYERRYREVITLAERILQNERFMDKRIVKEIRYWLCLSLARRRDKRILQEVQNIAGPDHNFILGFYYRIIGKHDDAINKLNEVLSIAPTYYRAKRELVQVYLNTEQYDEAINLAKENYQLDKNNVYSLQSYFRCLIKLEGTKSKIELSNLLCNLEKNPHHKAREMHLTSKAEYLAYIENNDIKAIQTVEEAILTFPKNIYTYLTKLELLRKTNNIHELNETIKEIETKFDSESDIYDKLLYISSKCILLAKTGQKIQALNILEKKVLPNFSKSIYNKLLADIDAIIK